MLSFLSSPSINFKLWHQIKELERHILAELNKVSEGLFRKALFSPNWYSPQISQRMLYIPEHLLVDPKMGLDREEKQNKYLK